jgi:hypothetical protein
MGVLEARKATTQIYRLAENLGTRVRAVQAFNDPNLSAEGLERRRAEMLAKSTESAQARAAFILKIATDGKAFAESQVDSLRPKVDPENVAQLTRSAQAWEMTIKPLRDAGKSWFEIADVLDADGLLALNRFAEQSIRLSESKADAQVILANLQRAADKRLAEVHPDPQARVAFKEAEEARQYASVVETVANQLGGVRNMAMAASVMITAKHLIHPLGTAPDTPAPTTETMDYIISAFPNTDETVVA